MADWIIRKQFHIAQGFHLNIATIYGACFSLVISAKEKLIP